jgi:aromatic ring hydroxylase
MRVFGGGVFAMTFDKYLQSLRDGREVYYRGKRVDDVTKHPILRTQANLFRHFFEEKYLYDDPELGVRTSIFYKIPHNGADLLERSQRLYEVAKDAATVLPHISSDGTNALTIITSNLEDKKYFKRVSNYVKEVRKNNLLLAGAQMDAKGNRKLRPLQQEDPDLYVHVVEERADGIIVRGAKMHTTFSAVANGMWVLPSRAFRKGEEDYAISFVVPINAKGLKLIQRPVMETEAAVHDWEHVGTKQGTSVESLTIFDNVFVPWEHVFVYKDIEAASKLAIMFPRWHRISAISYRYGLAEFLLGMVKLVAEANGVDEAPHIVKNITDIIRFVEIQRVCTKMAALECYIDEASGIAVPNILYANIAKIHSNENYLPIIRSLIDTAGGIAYTVPSGDDYANEELRPYIKKYLRGAVPGEDRFKLALLIREWIGVMGGFLSTTYVSAEGTMQASLIEIYRQYDFTESKRLVKVLLSRMK